MTRRFPLWFCAACLGLYVAIIALACRERHCFRRDLNDWRARHGLRPLR